MKIIGSTEHGFILDASKEEVARLMGFYSDYECRPYLQIGQSINVNEMYFLLDRIRRAEPKLKEAKERLSALMTLMDLPPVIVEVAKLADEAAPKR